MPSRPPNLKPSRARQAWSTSQRGSRQERGYGREHEMMREQVLREEPLCRACQAKSPPEISPTTIADHIIPKAELGTDERSNYQGLCDPCSIAKTARESARARARKRR